MIDNIEKHIASELNIEAVIHMDPIVTDDIRVNELRAHALAAAESVDPRLCIHDFRYVEGQTHSNLIFDIAAPFEIKLSDDEIRQKVTAELRKIDPKFNTVITVDRG